MGSVPCESVEDDDRLWVKVYLVLHLLNKMLGCPFFYFVLSFYLSFLCAYVLSEKFLPSANCRLSISNQTLGICCKYGGFGVLCLVCRFCFWKLLWQKCSAYNVLYVCAWIVWMITVWLMTNKIGSLYCKFYRLHSRDLWTKSLDHGWLCTCFLKQGCNF